MTSNSLTECARACVVVWRGKARSGQVRSGQVRSGDECMCVVMTEHATMWPHRVAVCMCTSYTERHGLPAQYSHPAATHASHKSSTTSAPAPSAVRRTDRTNERARKRDTASRCTLVDRGRVPIDGRRSQCSDDACSRNAAPPADISSADHARTHGGGQGESGGGGVSQHRRQSI